jgi:methylisocitrate lyase
LRKRSFLKERTKELLIINPPAVGGVPFRTPPSSSSVQKGSPRALPRRHLFLIARTDAAASESMDGAVARARLYMSVGTDAIFSEALTTREMFQEFASRLPCVPLLANMTEFGCTPFFTASEFESMGYRMVIWPVSSLCVAAKTQEKLYTAIHRDGGAHDQVDNMQTRAELYATIAYQQYAALTPPSSKRSSPPQCPSAHSRFL